MYVVAGLPPHTHRGAVARLNSRFPERKIVGTPSKSEDGPLYPVATVDEIVKLISEFAIKRRKNDGARPPTPKWIILLYVPSFDQEALLRVLDFAVMPAPLHALIAYGSDGKQLRHDPQAVDLAISDALGPSGPAKCALDDVLQRLQRMNDREVALLPPDNFHIDPPRTLSDLFVEYRNHERPADDRFNELEPTRLTREDIPRFGRDVRHCHVDARGIAFLNAHPTAYDGAQWEKELTSSTAELLSVLRSLYRFGGALPSGFHHDVQRSDGKAMSSVLFNCCREGPISISAEYANIYPNDYIRWKK